MKWLRYVGIAALFAGQMACDDDPAEGKVKASVAASAAPAAPIEEEAKAKAVRYVFGNEDSEVAFIGAKVSGKHEGAFETFKGEVQLVDSNPEKSSVSTEIDMASVSIEPNKLEGHLKSPDFFDVEKFPKAKFESTKITKGGAKGATHTITGNLTLHGTTKAITFPATIRTGKDSVAVEAEFAINRKDFGIVYPGMPDDLIKDDVLIQLKLKAKRSNA